jgi:CRISPR/Cas system-associated protein Cas10 (large subunit of type III CRISPR-Cas system)
MLRWLKKKLRPPLEAGEPYLTNPTPENLYQLVKRRCPVCGLSPPEWIESERPDDAVCARCAAHYKVPQPGNKAWRVNRMR